MPTSRDVIRRLMLEYVRRTDAGDWDGVGALFDPGIFAATVSRGAGGAELAEARRRAILLHDGSPRTKHLTTNIAIAVDEDAGTAEARSCYTLLQGTPSLPAQVIGAGRYHDTFVREGGTEAAWRFEERVSYLDLRGDLTQHLAGIAPPSETDHAAAPLGPSAEDLPWLPPPADPHEAIEALMYAYCERMDLGDFAGIGRLFTHGRYGRRGQQAHGADEVAARLTNNLKLHGEPGAESPRTRHLTTNVDVRLAADGQTAEAYSYFWALQATPTLPLQTIATGHYEDRFALIEGEWAFTDRVLVIEATGDLSQHLPGTGPAAEQA